MHTNIYTNIYKPVTLTTEKSSTDYSPTSVACRGGVLASHALNFPLPAHRMLCQSGSSRKNTQFLLFPLFPLPSMFSPRQRGRPRLRGNCRLCLQVQCSRESWRQSGIKVASTKLTATQDSLGADCRHANRPVHCEEVAEMGVLKRHIYVEHQKSVTCFFF